MKRKKKEERTAFFSSHLYLFIIVAINQFEINYLIIINFGEQEFNNLFAFLFFFFYF